MTILATEQIVGVGNWENTVKVVLHPNSYDNDEVYGEKATQFPPDVLDEAREVMCKGLVYGATKRGQPLFMIVDWNSRSGWPHRRDLESKVEELGYERAAEVFGKEVVVYIHREGETVALFHGALSIAADARPEIPIERQVLRAMTIALLTNLSRYATGQVPDYRALEVGAQVEWVRDFVKMGARHSAVLGRQTISDDNINAITRSNLPLAPDGIVGQRARKSDAHDARALDNKSTRTDDNDVVVRALVLLSHASNEEEFDSAVETIHEMFLEGVDPSTRTTRWNLLTEDWLVSGSDTLERVLQKKKKLMANAGNVNARRATDDEVRKNNVAIRDLYELPNGFRFWLLDLKQVFPTPMPQTIQSPNPEHNDESYPVYQLKYGMVTSRIAKAGKVRVHGIKCPADRPPKGWSIEIVGKTKELSRAEVGGSVFVLCAVKKEEEE